MSKSQQVAENIKLSEKLARYLAKNPKEFGKLKDNSSFVTFSATNKNLNVVNKKLVASLKKEGKKLIEAQETSDEKKPWRFTATAS